MKPKRVQLSRRRGWRMPANTVKVDRTTKWGNPYKPGHFAYQPGTGRTCLVGDRAAAVALFKSFVEDLEGAELAEAARRELRGKNLACWCPPREPCHADVLLAIANSVER